ncbi:MAG: LysR substrate-binding domain-containing protein [Ramlibacter sp.]
MTLQQLRAFLTVVEWGSFRRAARQLEVSQAGLTNSLQALEAGLGVSLLHRSAHGVVLTEDGRRLHARALLIQREVQRATDEAASANGTAGGTLHVGVGPTTTALMLPQVVPDFHARYPGVKLRLMSGLYERLLPALQQGLIDLAITSVPDEGAGPGLTSQVLFKTDLTVIARTGHPLATARSLHELATHEWVAMGAAGGPGGTVLRLFAEHGLAPPSVAATCESFTELAALIGSTDWLALVPAVIVQRGLLGTQLQPIRIRERAHRYDNCLVRRTDPPLTPTAAAFAAMCESCARIIARLS